MTANGGSRSTNGVMTPLRSTCSGTGCCACSGGRVQCGTAGAPRCADDVGMVHRFCLALLLVAATANLLAQSKEAQGKEDARLETAGLVMEEVLDVPDGIPQDLLDKAECAIVVPSVTKLALGVG